MSQTILLIDDRPDFAIGMTHFLTPYGISVKSVISLDHARQFIAGVGKRIEGILLDINMHISNSEDLSGLEFLEELMAGKCPPVIVVTNYTERQKIIKIARRRPYSILFKDEFDKKQGIWLADIQKAVSSKWANTYLIAKDVEMYLAQKPIDVQKAIDCLATCYTNNEDVLHIQFEWNNELNKTHRRINAYRTRLLDISDAIYQDVFEEESKKDP